LIALPATISTTAIMNMASLMSTTTKEFTENTGNVVTASVQQQQQQQQSILTRGGGARNK
jgi:1,6-anhydro-N-acetylmuramate kinase